MRTLVSRQGGVVERLLDGVAAADPGLVRLRFATRTVLAVALVLAALSLAGLPLTGVLLGAVAALVSSSSLRAGSTGERLVQLVLMLPIMAGSLTVGTLLAPHRLLGDAVFLAVIFGAVYLRRFSPLGLGLGMAAFISFFFALFLMAPASTLPVSWLALLAGLCSTALVTLALFAEPPTRELRRLAGALRARMVRVVDEVIELVRTQHGTEPPPKVIKALRRQINRLHESALLIEALLVEDGINDNDRIVLPAHWRSQLTDVELTSQRLCIVAVRAVSGDISERDREALLEDLRGLRRHLARDPAAVLLFDEDALLRRLASYDIRGDAGATPTEPAENLLLAHRAIRELLIATARIRRTVLRASKGERNRDQDSDQPAGQDAEQPAAQDEEQDKEQDKEQADGLLPSTRQAIQCTVASALAMAGGELLSDRRWYWAVIASFVVFIGTSTRGELLVKGVRRVGGTLLGIVAGTVLASLLSGDVTLSLVLVLLCVYLGFYLVAISYTAMTFLITVMLGLLYDLLGTFTPDLLLLRLTETAVGAAAAILTSVVVLPSRTRSGIISAATDLLGSLREFLDHAIGTLVYRREADLIDESREIDRQFAAVRTAAAPVTHALSPFRDRRNITGDLQNLVEDMVSAVRSLARHAECGSMAGLPRVLRKRHLIDGNLDTLIRVLGGEIAAQATEMVTAPALGPSVNVRLVASRSSAGSPRRVQVLRLRRALTNLDRLDELVVSAGRVLGVPVNVTSTPDADASAVPMVRRHIL